MRFAIARVALVGAALSLLGAGCVRLGPAKGPKLVVWGLFDDTETLAPILQSFEKARPRGQKITVEYRKVSTSDRYEEFLRTALAERRGPDIFLLHATWVPRWLRTLLPAPPDRVPVRAVREEFVDTVAEDLVVHGRVVGLPLFVDSLALYVNTDLLNAAGIAAPPRTWAEVVEVVKRTTRFNPIEAGQIDRHGIALGTGRNVNRAPDIVSALFLQNGVALVGPEGEIAFGKDPRAVETLTFLTDFANPQRETYTWQLTSDYSLDAFAEGETALMVNYSYHRPTIRLKNPRLNFTLAPLPQLSADPQRRVTLAGYWAYAVSQQTAHPTEAWEFLRFLTATEPARAYAQRSGNPPARRDLVSEMRLDPELGVFAEQALFARNWKQPDNRTVDRVFTEALDDIVGGRDTVNGALERMASQVQAAAAALGPDFPAGPTPPPVRPR